MKGDAPPVVFVVSDSLGETAELVTKAAAIQFNSGMVEVRRIHHVQEETDVHRMIAKARKVESSGRRVLIVYTIILPALRNLIQREASRFGLASVDIMGPMMNAFAQLTGKPPRLQPGLVYRMDKQYFARVEAVEFAVKHDDGKDTSGLREADLVLLGISRSSKTPVSLFLAHARGLKVANLPLVPEIKPPEILFRLERGRTVGLTVSPEQLYRIRAARLQAMGLGADANYASMERIMAELNYAEDVFRRLRCPVIDATDRAIEETANQVLEVMGWRAKQR